MKNVIRSLCLLLLIGAEATCRTASAAEDEVDRKLESARNLTGHLVRSHSRDLVMQPIGSIRNLLFYTSTAVSGLVKDTALDAVLLPRVSDNVPPLATGPGMDLKQWESDLDRMTGRPGSSGRLELLVDGEAFFDRLVEEIEAAESSIRIRTYIFDNDDVALAIADRLKVRAREIPVSVLLDGVGTWGGALIESPTIPENHEGPVSVAAYLREDSRIDVGVTGNAWLMGDHTKTFVFDDAVAFLGGMNIGREYRHDWHDLMVELTGPVVEELSLDSRRARARHRWGEFAAFQRIERYPVASGPDDVPLRLLYTQPHDAEIYRTQLAAIQRSQRYIYIENAYLADDQVLYELIKARGRGVDVRVVAPNRPDSELMNRSNLVALNLLTEHGVRVYLYPGMTHVKAAIYDGWASLGTANFDKLSFKVNKEVNVATSDPMVVDALRREVFERDFRISRELTEKQPVQFADHVYERIVDVVL
jgi:cardiolipin synthase